MDFFKILSNLYKMEKFINSITNGLFLCVLKKFFNFYKYYSRPYIYLLLSMSLTFT